MEEASQCLTIYQRHLSVTSHIDPDDGYRESLRSVGFLYNSDAADHLGDFVAVIHSVRKTLQGVIRVTVDLAANGHITSVFLAIWRNQSTLYV
jgi:hypothetical protein